MALALHHLVVLGWSALQCRQMCRNLHGWNLQLLVWNYKHISLRGSGLGLRWQLILLAGYDRSGGIASCLGTGGCGVLLLGPVVNTSRAGDHAYGYYYIASGHSCVALKHSSQ